MRHVFHALLVILLGLWASTSCAAQEPVLTRLANGLTVYILRDTRFPLVCTRLYVRAGSATEEPSQAGISHLLEHMVFKGTDHRPKGQVAREVEALGGYLNAATSFDKTWYITDMPSAHWALGMDVVRDMAFQASLDPSELEAEKEVVISELKLGEDSPERQLFEKLQVAALAHTPYGRPIIGYEEAIRKLTVEDLRAYVRRWYQPRNMLLLVVGDVEPAEALARAQDLFGSLENHGDLPLPQPLDLAVAPGGLRVELARGPWNKVYLGVAFPVPGLRDARSMDLDVLSHVLGGDGAAYFYRKYKYERQLVEDISVDNMSLYRAGMLSFTVRLEAARLEEFWQEFTKDLARLGNLSPEAGAVQRARVNILDGMDRSGETLNGLAAWKGVVQFDLGGEQAEMNMRFALENVDTPQLRQAAQAWIAPGRARVRLLVPQEAVVPDLEGILNSNWPQSRAQDTVAQKAEGGASEVVELGPGRKLILLPDRTVPYMSLRFLMSGGNALLNPDQQGLADLCARLLTDGSGELNAQATERWFSERASSVSASAGLQTFGLSLTGPARFDADLFGMLRQILAKPRFEQQELGREVSNMRAAIRQRQDKPLSLLFSRLNPFLFPGTSPYGYDDLGTEQSLAAFNRDDVLKFWGAQAAMPWVLAVAGSFDREAVLDLARGLPEPTRPLLAPPAPDWGSERQLNLTLPGRNQAHLLQIYRTAPLKSPEAPALMLLQAALSGQSGLLFSSLRDEKGLGYTVTAFNRNLPETGFMAFYIGTSPEKIEESRQGFAKVMENLKSAPLPQELLRASANRLLGDYLRGRQSLASRAGEAAVDAMLGYPENFQRQLVERAAEVSPQDIMELSRKYFTQANAWEATLLP